MPSGYQAWVGLPTLGIAVAVVLTVIGARLTAGRADLMLAAAWILAAISIYALPVLSRFSLVPRLLCTLLISSIIGLILYQFRWTDTATAVKPETEPSATRSAPSIRLKYSSTQIIELSNEPGDYNDTLNLDNVATMVQAWDANLEEVGMVLTTSPPLRVDDPKAGKAYPSGPPDWTVEFPAADTPGISIKSARTLHAEEGKYFLFHRLKATTHVIAVGERKFRVTLLDVRDKSEKKKKRMLIQYTFGISEE